MNYGKRATEKKIKAANSKAKKYTSRVFLTLLKSLFVLCLFGGVVAASVGFGMVKGIIDNTPDVDIATIVPDAYATTVYNSAGNVTEILVKEGSNREEATYDELPQNLINAFIAYEDARFMEHNGIDLRSILRAVRGVLTGDSSAGGGSTITQQLIKNSVFGGGMEKSFGEQLERKLQEWNLAIKLDGTMSKEQIITNYLNTINLGNNTLGVKVAARRYFNKEVSDLTLSECAVLAGITQNPSRFNPISGQKANADKQKVILQYMYDQNLISKAEQEEALADDVYSRIQNVDIVTKETASTPYSYFTDELIEQVMEDLKDKLGYTETQAYNKLYSGGLSIYTTQDPELQAIVDEEVNNPENYKAARYSIEYRLSITHGDGTTTHYSQENIKRYHKDHGNTNYDGLYDSEEDIQADVEGFKTFTIQEGDKIIGESLIKTLQPQASFVLMDQKTGEVLAISGGRGPKTASLTLNRASNTYRQPGSTFKVLTAFAPAMDTCGATLGSVYYDSIYTVGTKTFSNWYSSGYQGYSSIRDGIIYSMNIVAVRCLMETVTPQLGVEYAENFGITTLNNDYNAALALGGLTDGVSNLEMTAAYATIANEGIYTKPRFFTKILDHDGKVLIDNTPETHRVLNDSTAFLLTDALAGSMQSSRKFSRAGAGPSSTSASAAIPGMSNAGKSGTTTANNDIWFIGYTPYYTAGIWAGCDNNQKLTSKNGGTSFHKAMWKKIMIRIHEDKSDPGFAVPDSIETAEICRKSGKLAVSGVCNADPRGNAVYTEYFAKGTVPTDVCNNHVRATVCSDSHRLPTAYCPSRTTAVFMALPAGEEGTTDDSVYAMPGYCNIHTENSVIIPPSEADPDIPGETGGSPGSQPYGPGYVSPKEPVTIPSWSDPE